MRALLVRTVEDRLLTTPSPRGGGLRLPKMDGPELVERIRDHRPGIPVFYISGYLREDLAEWRFPQPGAAVLGALLLRPVAPSAHGTEDAPVGAEPVRETS
jgi:hypothetical protein